MASSGVVIRKRSEMDNKVCFVFCINDFCNEIYCHVMPIFSALIICRNA